jgi:hypothetical protein
VAEIDVMSYIQPLKRESDNDVGNYTAMAGAEEGDFKI